MRKIAVLAGLATALLVAGPAAAATAHDDTDNLYSAEACKVPGKSKFDFHIYYNSAQSGAWRNIGYSVYNFADVPDGVAGAASPLRFCSSGAGAGQGIKNNAASGENSHYKYTARVYYNSGFKGAQDVMAPYQYIDRFVHVFNQDASFQWT
ncbi:hypothetical protein ACWDBF_09760 [Streptomyces angustmyceticus]|uniref:hypothetical protein n=1 Tax=Streptomyces angustmyceticus TaxID=285578 RepID=UPI0036D1AD05